MSGVLAVLLAFLLGSIPFAYIFAHIARGIDIRQVGDGNVGAANVFRHAGLVPGIATAVTDVAKGTVAVIVARAIGGPSVLPLLAGTAAVAGHVLPFPLNFRGGRGAGTAMGVLLALVPREVFMTIGLAALAFFTTRSTKWCAGAIFVPLPLLAWLMGQPVAIVVYSFALPCMVGLIHFMTMRHLPAEARNEAGALWVARSARRRIT
jgi:glycerol-3-phosphate acyltransferase PlsY